MKWMSKKAIDYSGQTANGFVVLRRDENHERKANISHWRVRCEKCGLEKVVQSTAIRTKSVGRCRCEKQDQTRQPRIDLLVSKKQKLRLKIQQIDTEIRSIHAEGKQK